MSHPGDQTTFDSSEKLPPAEAAADVATAPVGGSPSQVRAVSRRRTTIVNLLFQYGSLVLTLVHGILMVPLYLEFIDEGLYGAWLSSGNVLYLAAVAQGGATYLLAQRTAQQFGERKIVALGETIGSGLLLLICLSSVVALVILALIPLIPIWFSVEGGQRSELTTCLLLMIPAVWLRLLIMGLTAIEQGLQRPFGVGVASLATGTLHLVVTVLLLVWGYGLVAIPAAILLREITCVIPMVWMLAQSKRDLQIPIRIRRQALKSLSKLSVWTFLTFLNDALANGTTLLLVGLLLGKEKVPVVTVSRAAWEILTLVLRRFIESVQPSLAHFRGEATKSLAGGIAKQVILVVTAGLAVGVSGIVALNAPFVALWIKPRVHLFAGDTFNFLYAIAVIGDVIVAATCQLSLSLGEIRGASIVQTTVLASRVVLNALLLPLLGVLAVPISIILAVLIGIVPLVRLWHGSTERPYSFPIDAIRAWGALTAGGVVGYFGHRVFMPLSWLELFIDAGVIAIVMCLTTLALIPTLFSTVLRVTSRIRY